MVVGFAMRQVKNAEARQNCRQWRLDKSGIHCTVMEQEINSTMKKILLDCNLSGICLGDLHFQAGDAFHQTKFSIRATLSSILRRMEGGNLPIMRSNSQVLKKIKIIRSLTIGLIALLLPFFSAPGSLPHGGQISFL